MGFKTNRKGTFTRQNPQKHLHVRSGQALMCFVTRSHSLNLDPEVVAMRLLRGASGGGFAFFFCLLLVLRKHTRIHTHTRAHTHIRQVSTPPGLALVAVLRDGGCWYVFSTGEMSPASTGRKGGQWRGKKESSLCDGVMAKARQTLTEAFG